MLSVVFNVLALCNSVSFRRVSGWGKLMCRVWPVAYAGAVLAAPTEPAGLLVRASRCSCALGACATVSESTVHEKTPLRGRSDRWSYLRRFDSPWAAWWMQGRDRVAHCLVASDDLYPRSRCGERRICRGATATRSRACWVVSTTGRFHALERVREKLRVVPRRRVGVSCVADIGVLHESIEERLPGVQRRVPIPVVDETLWLPTFVRSASYPTPPPRQHSRHHHDRHHPAATPATRTHPGRYPTNPDFALLARRLPRDDTPSPNPRAPSPDSPSHSPTHAAARTDAARTPPHSTPAPPNTRSAPHHPPCCADTPPRPARTRGPPGRAPPAKVSIHLIYLTEAHVPLGHQSHAAPYSAPPHGGHAPRTHSLPPS
jgi:hypothetical protein